MTVAAREREGESGRERELEGVQQRLLEDRRWEKQGKGPK